jgi:uncharacterized protein
LRVFLDTNVLASAFGTRGLCADVLRAVLASHTLVVGEVVLRELRRALISKFKLPAGQVADVLAFLRTHEVTPTPKAPAAGTLRDPDDAWVLASAVAGRADVLVSGDGDLLAVGDRAPLPIVSPRTLWNMIAGQAPPG